MNVDTNRFLSVSKAAKHFGVCQTTIRKWNDSGLIQSYRINGSLIGHRRIDIESFRGKIEGIPSTSHANLCDNTQSTKPKIRGAIYCRVSSSHQKDDLARQITHLQQLYPEYEIFKDIASGINFKRQGFLKLIEKSIKGDLDEIVVAHKDRFSRFAFDFIEWILQQYSVKLLVLDKETHKSTEQELADDLLSIVHVFSCRQNGKRSSQSISKQKGKNKTEQ